MTTSQHSQRPPLAPSAELVELLALRRVASGGVALFDDTLYLHRGRPMPPSHSDALDNATVAELVLAGARDRQYGSRRVHLTDAGSKRLATLEERLRVTRPPGDSGARHQPGRSDSAAREHP